MVKIEREKLINLCTEKFDTFKDLCVYNDSHRKFNKEITQLFDEYYSKVPVLEVIDKVKMLLNTYMLETSAEIFVNELLKEVNV